MAINLTNRKPNFAKKRSHALNTSPKKQKLNLQTVKLENGKKVRLSTKEIKTLKKNEK
ncbi:MAG: 50S ribosomal protein L28 [Tenericutes bacterium]|jgi:ribosomal protein L28|nr:50S ribosomal protein L28 [Mycoplasmatota bacterium]